MVWKEPIFAYVRFRLLSVDHLYFCIMFLMLIMLSCCNPGFWLSPVVLLQASLKAISYNASRQPKFCFHLYGSSLGKTLFLNMTCFFQFSVGESDWPKTELWLRPHRMPLIWTGTWSVSQAQHQRQHQTSLVLLWLNGVKSLPMFNTLRGSSSLSFYSRAIKEEARAHPKMKTPFFQPQGACLNMHH